MKQKQTHRYREQTCPCQGDGDRRGKDWEFGISRSKLLYREWINNKVLLYITGNYVQYPIINYNRKEKKEKKRKLSSEELVLLNCGVGEDSWRVPWTARRSNQSILKEISPGCLLEGLKLKLKLQCFGHLM